jgi:hypothetical protein
MKKFLVDSMLGKLAKWLRLLGYDTIYTHIKDLHELKSLLEKSYIFLTRQHKWLAYRVLRDKPIYLVQADKVNAQLAEVIKKFNLEFSEKTFCSRCIICNNLLVEKKGIEALVPEYIRLTLRDRLKTCPQCQKVYWPGSHQEKMKENLKRLFHYNP